MLKKLLPAVLGALLIGSPVIAVTTATAAPQAAQTAPMKSHHKATKQKMASHHKMAKKHWKKKAKKKAPGA